MRGQVEPQRGLFSYFSVEERIPVDHPLRRVKAQSDAALVPQGAKIESRRVPGLDQRTTRHEGYATSRRKCIEEIFGWIKTVGSLRKSRFMEIAKTQLAAHMEGAAFNRLRMARVQPTTG